MTSIRMLRASATIVLTMVLAFVVEWKITGQQRGNPAKAIEGAWRVVEVTTYSQASHATNSSPQPGLVLFTANHFSIVRVSSRKPRPDFGDAAHVKPEEALAIWGNDFQAQAGTYEVAGNRITTHIVVAKNPQNMQGWGDLYTFELEGKTLVLTQVNLDVQGPNQNLSTLKLARAE